eukprot:jgi/Botrbrau1/14044/Bobra.0011s0010.1
MRVNHTHRSEKWQPDRRCGRRPSSTLVETVATQGHHNNWRRHSWTEKRFKLNIGPRINTCNTSITMRERALRSAWNVEKKPPLRLAFEAGKHIHEF